MAIYELDGHRPEFPASGRYWVADSAELIGKVVLGEDVTVWFNAVLRGDNDPLIIGRGSNIQDGVVVHTDRGYPVIVGENCTIGHNAILHSCVIGDGSLIGMGATVLNRAKIGRNSIVGANALVTEDKEFPDNSLILGTPARVVRTIDAVDMLKDSAERYTKKGLLYRAALKRLD